jgi:hypothetical protein
MSSFKNVLNAIDKILYNTFQGTQQHQQLPENKLLFTLQSLNLKLKGAVQPCDLKIDCALTHKWFLPSSSEALSTKRGERHLLAKERN